MLFDYETLRVIWWLLLGVLLIGFAIMDGFDLGVAALLPFVAKTDEERRILINTIGPVWEGNQVWFILGGGAIFAAFPPLYAVSFSGFYLAMFLVLAALILRPVGFKYRSKVENPQWRRNWDWALFIGGAVPALIFGVALGNVLLGVPFTFDQFLRPDYQGGLFGLLNPFALLVGLVSVSMLAMHGAGYLAVKTEGIIADRARAYGQWAALATIVLFALAGLCVGLFVDGYLVTSEPNNLGPSNPLAKTVTTQTGAWLQNYADYPWMLLAPLLGFTGAVAAWRELGRGGELTAFIASAVSVFGIVATAGVSLFPFLLPSSLNADASLTVWDATSSHLTLNIMLIATVIFLPIVLVYTSWAFHVMRGKVTTDDVKNNSQAY